MRMRDIAGVVAGVVTIALVVAVFAVACGQAREEAKAESKTRFNVSCEDHGPNIRCRNVCTITDTQRPQREYLLVETDHGSALVVLP